MQIIVKLYPTDILEEVFVKCKELSILTNEDYTIELEGVSCTICKYHAAILPDNQEELEHFNEFMTKYYRFLVKMYSNNPIQYSY